MATVTPTSNYPSFVSMANDARLIQGILFDLGNEPDQYIAGKICSPVAFPTPPRENELGIDGRALHGRIARRALFGAYGDPTRSGKVAFGQRAVPIEGREMDPLFFATSKYFNSYSIPAEKMAEIEEWGIDAFVDIIEEPRTQVLIDREKDWATLFSTTGNWTTTASASKYWTAADSNPVADINNLRKTMSKYGVVDTLILGIDAAYLLMANVTFNGARPMDVDRAILTEDQLVDILKSRFGFQNIFIGRAVAETSRKASTPNPVSIWGNTVWMGRIGDQLRGTSSGSVEARRSAVVNVVSQELFADVIGPRINPENNDCYCSRVRMAESLTVAYPQLGATLTGITA